MDSASCSLKYDLNNHRELTNCVECFMYLHVQCTTTTVLQPLSKTKVSRYQKKHSPTRTYSDHQLSFVSFLHLQWSVKSIIPFHFTCLTVFLHNLYSSPLGLPLVPAPFTSYSLHFFTQSLSHFATHAHRNLLCCGTEIMSSNPSLSQLYLELYLLS